jgi:hypothetical protein
VDFIRREIMRIPDDLRIPAIVFGLEAVLLTGAALVFFVLIPT